MDIPDDSEYPLSPAAYAKLASHIRNRQKPLATGVWALPARNVMKAPLVGCTVDNTVAAASGLMRERNIGSLGVFDREQKLIGMITQATLCNGMITHGIQAQQTLTPAVWEAPLTIDAATPLWKAQSEQERLRAKYLVVQESGQALGIVSQTDILQTLLSYQRSVLTEISDAADFSELGRWQTKIATIAAELQAHNHHAGRAVRGLSEVHLAIQRRCIRLVLDELHHEGNGTPPLDFALLVMGSCGRREAMLQTDQDNAIVLADTPADQTAKDWFIEFCERVNHRLHEVGYEWCQGNIMARNPDFHKSLQEWQTFLSRIITVPNEKAARWASIFFDFEVLYGDDQLGVDLRRHLLTELKRQPRLLRLMVLDDADSSPALGLFNRLATAGDKERKGKIDLKRNGLRILADAARVYALSEGIAATNSGDRIHALVRQGRLDAGFAEAVLAAYDELLELVLAHQLRSVKSSRKPDKLIDPAELTPLEEEALRMSMRILKRLQNRMRGEFGTIML